MAQEREFKELAKIDECHDSPSTYYDFLSKKCENLTAGLEESWAYDNMKLEDILNENWSKVSIKANEFSLN